MTEGKELFTKAYLMGVRDSVKDQRAQIKVLERDAAKLESFLETSCHHPMDCRETIERLELEDNRNYGDREVYYRDTVCGICGKRLETWKKC